MKSCFSTVLAAMLVAIAAAQQTVTYYPNASWNNENIYQWVYPGTVVAVAVVLGILCVFGTATYQLMSIQTPIAFEHKSPNWGKVEETE